MDQENPAAPDSDSQGLLPDGGTKPRDRFDWSDFNSASEIFGRQEADATAAQDLVGRAEAGAAAVAAVAKAAGQEAQPASPLVSSNPHLMAELTLLIALKL